MNQSLVFKIKVYPGKVLSDLWHLREQINKFVRPG